MSHGQTKQEGFDYRTHLYDPKTHEVTKHQPYRMVCEGGLKKFKRDGRWYDEMGELLTKDQIPEETLTATKK